VTYEPKHGWRYQSKCWGTGTNTFYPPRARGAYRDVADEAKSVCWGTGDMDAECPVRKHCLLYAFEKDDPHGIWGGLSHRERSHLLRKFRELQPSVPFQQWVMESDGGAKAKQFIKQVPRYTQGSDEARRAS
jgi:WhiB family redox-sensing transcriptional regulator